MKLMEMKLMEIILIFLVVFLFYYISRIDTLVCYVENNIVQYCNYEQR